MRKRSSLLLIVVLGVALLYRNRHHTSLQRMRANVRAFDLPTAGMYDALVASVLSGLYERVADEVAASLPSGTVLEVGSGPGRLAVLLAQRAPGLEAVGVDISPEMVERAARRVEEADLGERVRFEAGTLARCRFPMRVSTERSAHSPCTTGRIRPAGWQRSTGSSSPGRRHGSTIWRIGCGDRPGVHPSSSGWWRRAHSTVKSRWYAGPGLCRRSPSCACDVYELGLLGAQPSKSDRDEPADRGLGRQASGCGEGVEAVARKLLGRDITPDVVGLCGLDQQVFDHIVDLLLRSGDVRTSMQECSEFGAGVLMGKALVGKERVSLEHRFEPLASGASPLPDFSEIVEMAGDLVFVPGEHDRCYVWEVLV